MKQLAALVLTVFCALFASGQTQAELEKYKPDYEKAEIYLDLLKRTPLSGVWERSECFSNSRKVLADFEKTSKKKWKKVLVPDYLIEKKGGRKIPVLAFYKKDFTLPKLDENERAILYFDDIVGDADIFINGKKVGRYASSYHVYYGPEQRFSTDVTHAVRTGKNQILVRFYHSGENLTYFYPRGIFGLVYCDILPQVFCRHILVTPDLDRKGACVEVLADGPVPDSAKGEIFDWKTRKTVAVFTLVKSNHSALGPILSGAVRVPSAVEWSCDNPYLYGVRIRNSAGEVMGVQRFGFRTIRVSGDRILLNDRPIFLRGTLETILHGLVFKEANYAFAANPEDFARRYFESFRKMNFNQIRTNTQTLPRRCYELMDEIGLLVRDELVYPTERLKRSVQVDHIDKKNYAYACDAAGKLHPHFTGLVRERLLRLYSHPCAATFSFGNELRSYSPDITAMLNNIYDLYKSIDRQNRPCMSSCGRYWNTGSNIKELFDKKEKHDMISVHDYTGGPSSGTFADSRASMRNFIQIAHRVYAPNKVPVINGECVYFSDFYYQQKKVLDKAWSSPDAAEPEWDDYLYLMNEWRSKVGNSDFVAYLIRSFGAKALKYDRSRWRAIHQELILEEYRKLWPELCGYDILTNGWRNPTLIFPGNLWPFDCRFGETADFHAQRRANAPLGAFPEKFIRSNLFTGRLFKNRFMIVQNAYRDAEKVTLALSLTRGKETVFSQEIPCGTMKNGEVRMLPVKFPLPQQEGTYSLNWKIVTDLPVDTPEYRVPIRLASAQKLFAPISVRKKIVVFDEAEKFGALKSSSTTRLLKQLKLDFTAYRDGRDLRECDLLIIGSDSVGGEAMCTAAPAIRKYIEDGGRVLVFEQNFVGRIPFLEELECKTAGNIPFTEITQGKHPLLNGISQEMLFIWNNATGAVFSNLITPVSRCAITTGGNIGRWGCDLFGMVHAQLKLGKGDVLFVQSNVTSLFRKDSAAALLARNAIRLMLDDSSRKFARNFVGMQKRKTTPIPYGSSVLISLAPACNASFADEKADDRRGSWNDQGPRNDLRSFPSGRQIIGGTVYDIVEPKGSKGFSCVAVSGRPGGWQGRISQKIPVGKKVKRLQFLHTGAWVPEQGRVGTYLIDYADGKTLELPLVSGDNFADWWATGRKLKSAECLWSTRGMTSNVGVFGWDWVNPHSHVAIRAIRLRADAPTVIALFGITGETL